MPLDSVEDDGPAADPVEKPKNAQLQWPALAWLSMVAVALSLGGCQAIGDIFKAGFWVGIIAVVAVVAVIAFAVRKLRT